MRFEFDNGRGRGALVVAELRTEIRHAGGEACVRARVLERDAGMLNDRVAMLASAR